MSRVKFRCRAFVSEDDIDITTWDDELTPMSLTTIPINNWAHDHLAEWDYETWAENFETLGSFEVVFEATLEGSSDQFSREWDEEVTITPGYKIQPLTEEFMDMMWGDGTWNL